MARLQKKSLTRPEEVRPVGRGQLEIVELGDTAIGRIRYQPGWRWSDDVRPLVGTEMCQVHHFGLVLSGRLRIEMDDGASLDLGPDDVFEVPPGHDAWVVGDEPWVSLDWVGRRSFARPAGASAGRLATMVFTDLVGSTELAARLGDAAWRDRLSDYYSLARTSLERFGGREVNSTGDGLLAIFDSPARAIRFAAEVANGAGGLGLQQRAGVHTGEVEQVGTDVRGIAVHVAARVAAAAGADEVLVSAATRALVAGSGITLTDRGEHSLKGIDQPMELYAAESGS